MRNAIAKLADKVREYVDNGGSPVIGIFAIILGIAGGFGIVCFEAWILSLLYGMIANAFNLPQFGFWFFVLVLVVLGWIVPKKEKKE